MIGFHIDMNVAQFNGPYLERWLRELSQRGYDTIIWEVENNIQWQTCPECVAPEAFSKKEFSALLDLCRDLNLDSIPLLQTIGHCEYVLKHDRYHHLAEHEGRIDQYCPRNPDVVPFLHAWIEEYLELFGDIRYFHLGADEAWSLGHCDQCHAYARQHSLSALYIEHVNAVCAKFDNLEITPIIWADMVLHHHQALETLSRSIMLFDWMYDIHRGNGKVHFWGLGCLHADESLPSRHEHFTPYLYPHGNEPGRDPETFYTADYLADHGFQTVTCPASASHGDSVFAPRHWYHTVNTFDSFQKGNKDHLAGSVLTSWTVRLFPWELQTSCIDIPDFIQKHPQARLEDFQRHYAHDRFGLDDMRIWTACGLLSKPCCFCESLSLGFNKHTLPVPIDFVENIIQEYALNNQLTDECEKCQARLTEYQNALALLQELRQECTQGKELLQDWILAAHNLINRAEVGIFLLRSAVAEQTGLPAAPEHYEHGKQLLADLCELKISTDKMYQKSLKPARRAEIITWIYDTVEHALRNSLKNHA